MKPLQDRVAIITGASSGIGRATALALARQGASVVLTARRTGQLEEVAAQVRSLGGAALVAPADVTDQAQVKVAVDSAVAAFGGLDIVMANAGIYVRGPIESLTPEDFRRCMDVNFHGAVCLVLAALPHLRAQRRGHIVLMSSVDGKKAVRTDAPYAASKFALAGFGDVLRQDLAAMGIDVSILFPARVATPMIAGMKIPAISAPISPEAVANAVVAAIRRRRAEVIVPFRQVAPLLFVNWLSPRLGDLAIRTFHLEGLE